MKRRICRTVASRCEIAASTRPSIALIAVLRRPTSVVVGSMSVMRWLKSPAAIAIGGGLHLAETAEREGDEPPGQERAGDEDDEREDAVDADVLRDDLVDRCQGQRDELRVEAVGHALDS